MSEIKVKKSVHNRNESIARENHQLFQQADLLAVNILGSPGSGKTSLVEKTVGKLADSLRILVVEGDVETERDADRIRALGVEAIQIQTHGACHLDAVMVSQCLKDIKLSEIDLLIIENIGNLICPASFALGEDLRVIVGSTPEGDEKPVKYPEMYFNADACVINKIDLLDYINFNMADFEAGALRINEKLKVFKTSCTNGQGIEAWCDWLKKSFEQRRRK